jgi:hypothetical protein
MKNMPEDKFVDELSNRMRGIDAVPDQLVWKNLNARLAKDRDKKFWLSLVGKGTLLLVLLTAIVTIKNYDIYSPAENEPRQQLVTSDKNDLEEKSHSAGTIV